MEGNNSEFKTFQQRRELLEIMLYYGTKGYMPLSTRESLVLSNIVNSTLSYSGLDQIKLNYDEILLDNEFEMKLWKQFRREMHNANKINANVKEAILKLAHPRKRARAYCDGQYSTELYSHFVGFGRRSNPSNGICPIISEPKFYLPKDLVEKIQMRIVSLSHDALDDLISIGTGMKEQMNKDILYASKNLGFKLPDEQPIRVSPRQFEQVKKRDEWREGEKDHDKYSLEHKLAI